MAISLDGKHAVSNTFDIRDRFRYPCDQSIKGVEKNLNGRSVLERFQFADLQTSKYPASLLRPAAQTAVNC